MKLIVSMAAIMISVTACTNQRSSSSAGHASCCAAAAGTNPPGKAFTTKDGTTFYLGAMTINGTNVPMTNVQVR